MEESAQAFELDLTRKLDEERNKLREEFQAANQKKESEIIHAAGRDRPNDKGRRTGKAGNGNGICCKRAVPNSERG